LKRKWKQRLIKIILVTEPYWFLFCFKLFESLNNFKSQSFNPVKATGIWMGFGKIPDIPNVMIDEAKSPISYFLICLCQKWLCLKESRISSPNYKIAKYGVE